METSVNPTPASTGGTALTWWGGSTAPAPPPTSDPCVNGEEGHTRTFCHLQRQKSSQQVGARLKLLLQKVSNVQITYSCVSEVKTCPTEGPTACQQLCTVSYHSFTCSCLAGFKLQSDRRSCLPEGLLLHKTHV